MANSPYRKEYIEALTLIAAASQIVADQNGAVPVLVGGAVVEFDTAGAITSGDFDMVASDEARFSAALVSVGFVQGNGLARRTMTFVHTKLLIGVELVAGPYFDGFGDRSKVRVITVGDAAVHMASTEDMISDRLGQWIASDRKNIGRLLQALTMFRLVDGLDRVYLEKRIRQDTAGELGLGDLERLADDHPELGEARPTDPDETHPGRAPS